MAQSLVSIQNAPALPTPGAGLADVSELLGKAGIFKDITGGSPGDVRTVERAAPPVREHVPECVARAAARPDLNTAVSEKRRSKPAGTVDFPNN